MFLRFLILLTALLPVCAQTTSLSGLVQDPKGATVVNANVTVTAGSSPVKTAITSSDGRYRIDGLANGPATLAVEAEGFRRFTKAIQISGSTQQDVNLELGVLSESVLVTASGGTAIALEEAGISATVFTEKDFQLRQPNRVSEMLQQVPGLNVVQAGSNGGITSIFMRGGDSNAAMVLLDGVPVTDPGGAINLASVSSAAMERMEIVRGPQSSLYGAEAASGVIQMFTKRGDPERARPHAEVMYERGSFSTDHWNANLNGGFLSKGDYSLSTDQFRSTGQFANNVFRNTTGTGSLGYRLSNNTSVRGLFREYDSYTGAPGASAFGAYNLDAQQRDRDSVVGVKLDDTRNDWFSQRVNFGYHRQRFNFQDFSPESYKLTALVQDGANGAVYFAGIVPAGSTAAPGTRVVNETISTFPGGNVNVTDRTSGGYQATMSHKGGMFVAGYDFERQSGLVTGQTVDRRNNGLSLFEQYAWRQRIFLSAGARIEHSNVFGYRFAPRGAVTFKLPTNTFLRFSLARGIKQPSLLENFANTSFYVGNPSLRPAKTDSFEAGLQRQWWNNRVQTEVTYFRNLYSDLIQYVSGPPPFYIGSFQNVAKSRSRGVELTGSVKLTSMVKVSAGYTRLNSLILDSPTTSDVGQTLLRRPRNSGTTSLEFTKSKLSAIIGARFVGVSRNSFANFGVNRISAYNVAYLTVNYQATRHLQVFVRVNNLNNESYQEVNGYGAWSRNASGGLRLSY